MSIFDHRKNKKSGQTNKGEASRMSNAFASLKSQPKSQEEIAKEFIPSKGQTFKHDNGANLGNQKPKC
ncbi:hypothetical protein [Lysinibacillus antri]|uniref:Uncharacterized protein n=1 Tax=Lysinibacillus antri TaxID=2498145 RepID=A0A3S0RT95_9BACI|nr:hypothetical protein [Lysinibacillus antri]RUL45658.1 hypothetical protein EK386_19365 [Lysinibacillus antri]